MDTSHPTTHASEVSALTPEAAERRGRHLRILADLADIGMELVEHVRRQALEAEMPDKGDPILAFARLARAVRQTVALEARIAADGFAAPALRHAARSGAMARSRSGKMAQVRQKVEAAIAAAAGSDPDKAENLLCDLDERLDDPEYMEEMAGRPIGMVVALICGALGVDVDLRHFTDAELGFTPEMMRPLPPDPADPGGPKRYPEPPFGASWWPPRPEPGSDPP